MTITPTLPLLVAGNKGALSMPVSIGGLGRHVVMALLFGIAGFTAGACASGGARPASDEAVFTATEDGRQEVFVVGAASGHVIRLSDIEGSDRAPAWSPNSKQVGFLSDRSGLPTIWLMDGAGHEEHAAFPDEVGPVVRFFWSPDSRHMSYEVMRDGTTAIFVGDVTTGRNEAVPHSAVRVGLGGWSPDGKWVLYSALDASDQGVRRHNLGGVNEVRISRGADFNALWSPDGDHVAFNRRSGDGSFRLVVSNPSGNSERVVSYGSHDDTDFAWSPDGKQIVFVSNRDGNPEVYAASADGNKVTRLTYNRASDESPRWSKSGKAILFVSDMDGDFDLYQMRPDGSAQVRLVNTHQDEREGDW